MKMAIVVYYSYEVRVRTARTTALHVDVSIFTAKPEWYVMYSAKLQRPISAATNWVSDKPFFALRVRQCILP
jgi:hypothetical protein